MVSNCVGEDAGDTDGVVAGAAEGGGFGEIDLVVEEDITATTDEESDFDCTAIEYSLGRYADYYLGLDDVLLSAGSGWLAKWLSGAAEKAVKSVQGKYAAVTKVGKEAEDIVDKNAAKVAGTDENGLKAAIDDAADSQAEEDDWSEAFHQLFAEADAGDKDESVDLSAVEEAAATPGSAAAALEPLVKAQAAAAAAEAKKTATAAVQRLASATASFGKEAIAAAWYLWAESELLNTAEGDTGVQGWLGSIEDTLGLTSSEQVTTSSSDLGQSMSMTSHFSYDLSTPTRADYVDGDGDSFLLINSFFSVGQSRLLSASPVPYANGSCPVQYQPDALSWQSGLSAQTTMQWVSQHDVLHTVLPRLLLTAAALTAQYGLSSFPFTAQELTAAAQQSSQLAVGSPAYLHVQAVGTSIDGWLSLLVQNEVAKSTAVPFLHQFDSMAFSSWGNVTNRPNHTELGFNTDDVSQPLLFTFYGGGSATTISMHSSSDNTLHSAKGSQGTQDSLLNGGYVVYTLFGVELTQDGQQVSHSLPSACVRLQPLPVLCWLTLCLAACLCCEQWEISHLNDELGNSSTALQYNTVSYTFSDPDPDDSFTVSVMRDLVWGAPVFVTVGGASHCVAEANTTQRELLSIFSVETPAFTNLGSQQAVSTVLTMQSASETGETWPYWLEVMSESNPYGLALSINGQPLGARSHSFMLAASVAVQATLTIERPVTATSFSFPDIQLHLYSKPVWCTELCDIVCEEAFLSLSVEYAQPCSQVAFAGQLGLLQAFTVNAQSGTSLPIVLYNPEAAIAGRRWTDVNQTSLTNIQVQYRAAGSTLESDWLPALNAATGQPVSPLFDSASPPSAEGDYYSFAWAVQELSGEFSLRAATTCRLPQGTDQSSLAATDPSLLSFSTQPVPGRIDYELPQLLAYSPQLVLNNAANAALVLQSSGSQLYVPGQPLTVSFTEDVLCLSGQAELSIAAYAAPTSTPSAHVIARAAPISMLSYCEGNAVAFTFDPTTTVWPHLTMQFVFVQLTGITDLAGNALSPAYPASFVLHVGNWSTGTTLVLSSSTASLSAALRAHSSSSSSSTAVAKAKSKPASSTSSAH